MARPFFPASGTAPTCLLEEEVEELDQVDYEFSPSPSPTPSSPSYRDAVCGAAGSSSAASVPGASHLVQPPTETGAMVTGALPGAGAARGGQRRRRPSRRTRKRRPRPTPAKETAPHRAEAPAGSRRPRVDDDGFQEYLSRSTRRRLRREGSPAADPVRRFPPALDGRCFNCLSYSHRVATCKLPRRCLRCHGLHHIAKDCPRPRGYDRRAGQAACATRAATQQAGGAPAAAPAGGTGTTRRGAPEPTRCDPAQQHRFIRDQGPPTPTGSQAPSRTPSPPPTAANTPPSPGTPTGPAQLEPECCFVQFSDDMVAEESRLRFALVGLIANPSLVLSAAEAARDIAAAVDLGDDDVTVKPFHPDHFLVVCGRQETRDRILAASPIPLAGSSLLLRPWTRLVNATSLTLYRRVRLELLGIPPHAWNVKTVRKLLAPHCWVEKLEPATESKADLSVFSLFAWTEDPAAIPHFRRLVIAEQELPVVYPDPERQLIFGSVTPYLRQKRTLFYTVEIHLRSIADFTSRSPSTSGSSSPSEDGDSGPDGNPDRSYGFRQGSAGPRLSGFPRRTSGAAGRRGAGTSQGGTYRGIADDTATAGNCSTSDVGTGASEGRHEAHGAAVNVAKAAPKGKDQLPNPASCFPQADSNKQVATTGGAAASPTACEATAEPSLTGEPSLVKAVKAAPSEAELAELVQSVAFELCRSHETPPPRDEDPMLVELCCTEGPSLQQVDNTGTSRPRNVAASVAVVPTGPPVPVAPYAQDRERMELNDQADVVSGPPTAHDEHDGPVPVVRPGINIGPQAAEGECETREAETPERSRPANAATADSSPAGRDAEPRSVGSAKLSAFARAVQCKVRSPLAPRPLKTRRMPAPEGHLPELPKRSERLANHPLAMVASSKRAEVVLMRRLGVPTEELKKPAEADQAFKKYYAEEARNRNFDAFRDLLPSLKSVCPAVGLQA
ncbi:unnamed protein product [Urochloa decumbens]|uniref:CCHC-type domain-containing protein n=1 Tax=Urochloa decumbens TaxID=240449 RepID=A0ABC9A8A1_9POAL